MKRRAFLARSALLGLLAATSAHAAHGRFGGPGLLTVSGSISRSNREPLDPALDQMMVKLGVAFDQAMVFDAPGRVGAAVGGL